MATFYLVRHGLIDAVGRSIAGRAEGTHLNDVGRGQLGPLTDWLCRRPVSRLLCSPLERARETAVPLAERLNLRIETSDALLEIDFGEWTGSAFQELERVPRWRAYNSFRSGTRSPGGELMLEAQARVVGLMLAVRDGSPTAHVVLFSHGDVIRAALLYWLGMPIDFFLRLEVSPGSVSCVELDEHGARVTAVNVTPADWR